MLRLIPQVVDIPSCEILFKPYCLHAIHSINALTPLCLQQQELTPLTTSYLTCHTGNVFIVETDNQKIRLVNPSGIISTFAGSGTAGVAGDGGLAVNAQLNNPQAVAVDLLGT